MRWIFRIGLTLVTLVIVAALALFLIPSERIAGLAATQFEAATGRTLTISGEVKPTIFPRLGVAADGVTIANADWSDQGPMLTADRLDVGVGLSALLGGAVEVKRLQITGPSIVLERAADGRVNWDMTPPASVARDTQTAQAPSTPAAPAAASSLPPISVDLAQIEGGRITYIDHGANLIERLDAVDLTARVPSLQGTITAEGSALYNGAAVKVDGQVEGLETLLSGALTPLEVTVTSGGTSVALTGRAGLEPLGFDGAITASSAERAQIFAALGQTAPALPFGLGRDTIRLTSQLTLASEGSVHLRDMALSLDGNRISGAVDVFGNGDRPRIVARLNAGDLDLRGLSEQGRAAEGKAPTATAAGWSTDAIDVSAMSLVDADVTLNTGALSLGDATVDSVAMKATLDRGRAVATLEAVQLYQGTIAGEFIVNARGGLSSRANVSLTDLALLPFLTEFIDYDRLVGQVNGRVNILAVGNSMDALMKSLSGEGQFSIGQGQVIGLDLAGMLRNLDASFRGEGQKTVFDGISASFAVTDGILRNDDLDFKAPLAVASGAGVVNIGAQTLDYRVIPEVLRGEGNTSISVPVLITGSWADPKFRPDLEFLLDQELEKEKEALRARAEAEAAAAEEKAKAAARARLAEELEVDPETLTDRDAIEDAVKQRVEDELRGVLGGLLGGN